MIAINKEREAHLSLHDLRAWLDYNPETGIFTWKEKIANKVVPGAQAGGFVGLNYRKIKINNHSYLEHRLAWFYHYGEWPIEELDHINGITHDNRISNLRQVDRKENCKNRAIASNNTSGTKGIRYRADHQRWVAFIKIDGENIHLGSYIDKYSAVRARKMAEERYGFPDREKKQ
jgi:hypothetical protein